jgi:ParB/RepB/Spo0J family partition protein
MAETVGQKELAIESLTVSKWNVRMGANEDVTELADSIEQVGVLQPVIVRPVGNRYEVVAGSLRVRAAKIAGLKSVPAIIKKLNDEEAFVESAVENIQRHTLTPEGEAKVYAIAYNLFKKQEKVAALFSVSVREVNTQLEAARLVGVLEEARKPGHVPVSLPRDSKKVETISRTAKDLFENQPKKQVELFESLKDKSRDEVKRAVTHIRAKSEMEPKAFGKKPVKEMVEEAFRAINVDVSVTFDTKISKALIKVAEERDISWEEVVKIAVEQWLKDEGYLK